jgi:hypothetical protein
MIGLNSGHKATAAPNAFSSVTPLLKSVQMSM